MTDGRDWNVVAKASANISDAKLLQVFSLINKLPPDERPHDVLDAMRPRICQLKPPRPITLQRLLFLPVEDLFDPPELYRRRIGRLSRWSIRPCWKLVSDRLDAGLLGTLGSRIASVGPSDTRAINRIGELFWPRASDVLLRAIETGRTDWNAGKKLFGRDEDTWRQVEDIGMILAIGPEIEACKARLPPKPIGNVSQGHRDMLKDTLEDLARHDLGKVKTFILVLAARLLRPGELLTVLDEVRLGCPVPEHDGIVRDVEVKVVSNLTRQAQVLQRITEQDHDSHRATTLAKQLVEGFASLQETLKNRADPEIAEGVRRARGEIGRFITDTVLEAAEETMKTMLESSDAPQRGATDTRQDAAETYALSLRNCAQISRHVGVEREVRKKIDDIRAVLEHDGTQPIGDREEQEHRLISRARLVELMTGPDEAIRMIEAGLRRMGDGS